MSLSQTTQEWLRTTERQRQESAERRRTEWRADHTDIPDLEFTPPDCPICWLETEFDDGWFTCEGCDISWPENGYGHQACHADGSRFSAPSDRQEG